MDTSDSQSAAKLSSKSLASKYARRKSSTISIVNCYGNVDLTNTRLDRRYKHVPGKRLQPLCRKLGIKFADAVVGFSGHKRYGYKPDKDGVVISSRSVDKLLAEIAAREKRNPSEKRETARLSRAAKKAERLQAAGIYNPCSRTAQWFERGDIDAYEAQLIQFKAEYRHEHTDYDDRLAQLKENARQHQGEVRRMLLDDASRDARECAVEDPVPTSWEEYLSIYSFPYPKTAEALAAALKSPTNAHPVWFCEAVLAVEQAKLDLDSLSYSAVRDAISDWRDARM